MPPNTLSAEPCQESEQEDENRVRCRVYRIGDANRLVAAIDSHKEPITEDTLRTQEIWRGEKFLRGDQVLPVKLLENPDHEVFAADYTGLVHALEEEGVDCSDIGGLWRALRQCRCRLYNLGGPSDSHSNGRWTEVWDALDDPFGEGKSERDKLPNGELVRDVRALSLPTVHRKIDLIREELGIVTAGLWQARGIA